METNASKIASSGSEKNGFFPWRTRIGFNCPRNGYLIGPQQILCNKATENSTGNVTGMWYNNVGTPITTFPKCLGKNLSFLQTSIMAISMHMSYSPYM